MHVVVCISPVEKGNALAGWTEGLDLQTEKTEGSRTGPNVRPGIWKLFSVCGLSTGNFIMQTEVNSNLPLLASLLLCCKAGSCSGSAWLYLRSPSGFVSGLVQQLSQERWPFETFTPYFEHLNIQEFHITVRAPKLAQQLQTSEHGTWVSSP